jgi:hypothetical protein
MQHDQQRAAFDDDAAESSCGDEYDDADGVEYDDADLDGAEY